MIFRFEKPIYGSFYMIWDKWLKIAKRKNLTIVAQTEFGTATYKYRDWMDRAKKGKHPHNYPNDPMIFWGRSVLPDIKKRDERKKIEKKIDMSTNVVMTVMARLKKDKPELFNKIKAEMANTL